MGAWTALTLEGVTAALPTDLATLHAAWSDANPAKAGRLEAIVAENLAAFRQACAVNPAIVMDDAADAIPTTGYQHALNRIFFTLAMEMGVPLETVAYTLLVRADLWLSNVQRGVINPIGAGDGGSPRYEAPESEWGVAV
jgi:hypothetical protein